MIKDDLKYFLKTGRFKNFHFEMNRSELIGLLGETDWTLYSSTKDKFPSIYKYGRIEFYFDGKHENSNINGIMFQPIPLSAENGNLQFNYHHWSKNMSIENAISFLEINSIQFKEIENSDPNARELITESQVHIFFDCYDKEGKFVLHKAGKFIK